MDHKNLPTPPACVADFCIIPIGTPTASVSSEVAAVQRLLKGSGLTYAMHSAGTTVEGNWEEVTRVIGQAHSLLHQNGVVRIQTDIRIGTRHVTDKSQHFSEKVSKVEAILAADSSSSSPNPSAPASQAPAIAKKEESKVPTKTEESTAGKGNPGPLSGPGANKATWASMFK